MIVASRRLKLVACSAEVAQALLDDPVEGGRILGADVPSGWPSVEVGEMLALYLQELRHDPEALGWGVWIAVEREANTVVGSVGFKGRPGREGTVEIGYEVAPAHRGRGYATEAVTALLRWAFAHPTVRRVVAECAPDNAPSIRVLERAGFRPTGTRAGFLLWENRREGAPLLRSAE